MRLFQAWHDRPIEKLLEGQSHQLNRIEQELKRMTKETDDLKQAIVNLGAAVNGATAEISNLAAQLLSANSSNDSASVEASAQQITSIAASLNAAVAAAQPAPVPAPGPAPAQGTGPAPGPGPQPDVTAPVLSSATGTPTSASSATGTVSTDEGDGTLFFVVTTGPAPTATQIKAGQNSDGTPAADSGKQAVSVAGVQSVSATGLIASTGYTVSFMQEDAAGNQSNIVSSSISTPAA
jgi:hypothetical protein